MSRTLLKPYQPAACVVCEQPLSLLHYEDEHDPSYFPACSSGYHAGTQDERSCEDISQLLRHLQTINSAIWTCFMEAGNRRDLLELKPSATHLDDDADTDEVRSLCFLFQDMQEELERRFKQLFDRAHTRWTEIHKSGVQS